jgi:spermidine synthase
MRVLHDAAGQTCWITVRETEATRFLELDGCEEGAMDLRSEQPVFRYLWFHACSRLAKRPRRLLVLGAGAFSAPKCLALAHPDAMIDAVDVESELLPVARQHFRLGEAAFGRIRFHGLPAEEFLQRAEPPYDFVFDDLFDGFQHVPDASRTREHFRLVRRLLGDGGVVVKNTIWNAYTGRTQAACAETAAAFAAEFPQRLALALGAPDRGHNRLFMGGVGIEQLDWPGVRERLTGHVPPAVLENVEVLLH